MRTGRSNRARRLAWPPPPGSTGGDPAVVNPIDPRYLEVEGRENASRFKPPGHRHGVDHRGGAGDYLSGKLRSHGHWTLQSEAAVRALAVVVISEFAKHCLQVALIDHDEVVKTFRSNQDDRRDLKGDGAADAVTAEDGTADTRSRKLRSRPRRSRAHAADSRARHVTFAVAAQVESQPELK